VLANLQASLDKTIEQDVKPGARQANFKAKKAELEEGGKRAAEKDWVTQQAPDGLVPDVLIPTARQQPPIPPPRPMAERSVEDLYVLLAERIQRYRFVLVKGKADQAIARRNVFAITELLERRGEVTDRIADFVSSEIQKGGE
jgi:hypothetical protein